MVQDKIKPVFLDLSEDRLLSKCVHGKAQSNNEAEQCHMEMIPKRYFCRSTDIRVRIIICCCTL